jgi:hypothetical protein
MFNPHFEIISFAISDLFPNNLITTGFNIFYSLIASTTPIATLSH